ncbi:MAG: ATP-binding protein [Thermodesulfobacteriota bacterium]
MRRRTFKIRRKIIVTFLCCILCVLIFAIFSYQIHKEIGKRLAILEQADDLYQEVLELRRFEKNFFLYKERSSLGQAMFHVNRLEGIFLAYESELVGTERGAQTSEFGRILEDYKRILSRVDAESHSWISSSKTPTLLATEESLRGLGQSLLETTKGWATAQRIAIDRLSQRAIHLFLMSMLVFAALGVGLAFYIAKLLVRPLDQMQQAMEKIAQGDFSPLPETGSRATESLSLAKAFNRMIHELEQRQEELVQSRKIAAIGTLTSGIAHELNNPLNNIVLTAEALRDDLRDLRETEVLSMIQDILAESERASEIVRDLLDFSRSEHRELEDLSIDVLVNDTLRLVRNQTMLSGIEVEAQIPPDLPGIIGERHSLQQVFLNLFINAIQAMPDGGVLRVTAFGSDGGQSVTVEVADTGVGIAPEHIPRIFDPFFTTKQVGRGTGLGLSVTYGIVEKHGGKIGVRSEVGKGTTFTVRLPAR